MLAEIGDYEELSPTATATGCRTRRRRSWLEDYWRVLDESEAGPARRPGPDPGSARGRARCREAPPDAGSGVEVDDPKSALLRSRFHCPPATCGGRGRGPGQLERAHAGGDSLPVRLAVYLKLLGDDDSYPDAWRDPATGELPTMQQLAALDQVSLPTLRKRRDAAIARCRPHDHRKENG
jgi:hypothetical protein